MKRFLAYIGCIVLGGGAVALSMHFYNGYKSPAPSVKADTCQLEECLDGSVTYPIDQLEEQERITLIELGLEQLRLEKVAGAMVERFGQTMQPFAGVWRVQQRQSAELYGLFDKYGIAVPKVPETGFGEITASSTRAGCTQGLDQVRHFEERIYNERNSFVTRPDIRRFMQSAARMSRDTLKPAFERCAKQE